MKILLTIISLLLPMALSAQGYRQEFIDPQDTIDEVDLEALRDTSMIRRRNLAETTNTVNTLDYVLDDRYSPPDHTFENHWYDHIYVGGGYGVEHIKPQADDFKFRTMSQVSLLMGKELDKKNSLRVSVGGAWGYQRETNKWLTRIQTRLDYLYNLSTHFNGYNPARRMEVSLLAGAGMNVSWMHNTPTEVAPEGHLGLQLKCFTGPLGTINIEPYAGISADEIDVSGPRNWRGYDIFYGVNVNYSFFLVDNLSREARLQMLQSRLASDRLVDPQTLERWRTPWFIEASNGIVVNSGTDLPFENTIGHQVAFGVGRWLSPVMGVRASLASRVTRTGEYDTSFGTSDDDIKMAYNTHYLGGRVEALLNPFGFFKTFSWDAPWGVYGVFGTEIGALTKYAPNVKLRKKSESYNLGVHLWGRLSKDLQLFVEPRFTHNVYTVRNAGTGTRSMHGLNNWGVDMGLTMLIRSERYRDLSEMDETQNFIYRDIRGLRVGVGGGLSLLQRKHGFYTGSSLDWNGMALLEYRFNELHHVRAHADFLNLGSRVRGGAAGALWDIDNHLLFAALDYQINLTNLCGGRFHNRRFELEAFAGPALGFNIGEGISLAAGVPGNVEYTALKDNIDRNKKTMIGANVGMTLTSYIGKGFSAFLTPTLYLMNKQSSVVGCNTVEALGMHLYETLNVGVRYKIGSLRRNPEKLRRQRMINDQEWKQKQLRKEREVEERRKARIAERHNKRK